MCVSVCFLCVGVGLLHRVGVRAVGALVGVGKRGRVFAAGKRTLPHSAQKCLLQTHVMWLHPPVFSIDLLQLGQVIKSFPRPWRGGVEG